jgi:hypothetical protein
VRGVRLLHRLQQGPSQLDQNSQVETWGFDSRRVQIRTVQ